MLVRMRFRLFPLLMAATISVFVRAEESPLFKQAIAPRTFSFPADHGSHAGYQTEWWYVTGNVIDENEHPLGFQFTIFRRAIAAQDAAERGRKSAWAAGDIYLLHLAVSDPGAQRYVSGESTQRGVLGIAGATDAEKMSPDTPVRIWMKDAEFTRTARGWTLKTSVETGGLKIRPTNRIKVELDLVEALPPVLHGIAGEEGLSRKGPEAGQASYYYSVPRLQTSGTIEFDGKTFKIAKGLSWMDHEFGSNQLSADQAGWEWFSIQLADGQALMLYVLRKKNGSIESRSSGTWTDAGGRATHLALSDFELTPGRKWKSPHSGVEYTLAWTIAIPKHQAKFTVTAAQDDQEFQSESSAGMNYYEGAVHVDGSIGGKSAAGEGYLEITGKLLSGL